MDSLTELVKALTNAGPFALGAVFSAWLATYLFKAGHESMITAFKESENRCKLLLEDQRVKDNRFDELHRKLREAEENFQRILQRRENEKK